jgi:hypothetical protein
VGSQFKQLAMSSMPTSLHRSESCAIAISKQLLTGDFILFDGVQAAAALRASAVYRNALDFLKLVDLIWK